MNAISNFFGLDSSKINARQMALRTAAVAVVGVVGYNLLVVKEVNKMVDYKAGAKLF